MHVHLATGFQGLGPVRRGSRVQGRCSAPPSCVLSAGVAPAPTSPLVPLNSCSSGARAGSGLVCLQSPGLNSSPAPHPAAGRGCGPEPLRVAVPRVCGGLAHPQVLAGALRAFAASPGGRCWDPRFPDAGPRLRGGWLCAVFVRLQPVGLLCPVVLTTGPHTSPCGVLHVSNSRRVCVASEPRLTSLCQECQSRDTGQMVEGQDTWAGKSSGQERA